MRSSVFGYGIRGVLLAGSLALAGCSDDGSSLPPNDDGRGADAGLAPAPFSAGFDPAAPPNFTFAPGDALLDDPTLSAAFVVRVDAFFEGVLAPLQRLSGLMPRTVSIVYDRCGEANAFHDPTTDSILLCHELAESAYRLFADYTRDRGGEPEDETLTVQMFAAMAFILYHEIAHALDEQRDLPLAGNIESNIDSIAAVIAIETGRPLYAQGGGLLLGDQQASFLDRHGSGFDRAGDILCWTIGGSELVREFSAAGAFEFGAPIDFAAAGRDCVEEYADLRDVVRAWIPGLGRLRGEPPGLTADGGDASSSFRFEPGPRWLAGTGSGADVRERVEALFEHGFEVLDNAIRDLDAPIVVRYERCDASISAYDAAARTVTVCEELVSDAYELLVATYDDPTATDRAYALRQAYDMLWFPLYHQVGHAMAELGRTSSEPDVEAAADAIASVLLAEAGRGTVAFFWAALIQEVRADDVHGDAPGRASDLVCLSLGGDAALRADPAIPDVLIERFIVDPPSCIDVYAGRREEVRSWLAPAGAGS